MIRVALLAAILLAAACSGPSSPAPSGFPREGCQTGPVVQGAAGMGVSNEGFVTDVDAKIAFGAQTDGGCVRARFGDDE